MMALFLMVFGRNGRKDSVDFSRNGRKGHKGRKGGMGCEMSGRKWVA